MKPYYEDATATIYHGDCRDVLPSIGPVDLVLTDPPYARNGDRGEWRASASVAIGLYFAASKVAKGGAMLCLTTTSARGLDFTFGAVGDALPFNRLLTWNRTGAPSRVAGPWSWDAIAVLGFGRTTFGASSASSVFTSAAATPTEVADGHPSPIPIGVAHWLFDPFTATAQTVLDPFLGSGALLVPAYRTGRRVIGIEIVERYCEIAAKRLGQECFDFEEAV